MFLYEYELGKAAKILCEDLFKLKPGETFVITAYTKTDPCIVDTTASAAFAVGAKPLVVWTASTCGGGKSLDPVLPVKALTALLKEADAWVEFDHLIYTTPYDIALRDNKRLRHLCLTGINTDIMVRCIGQIDYTTLKVFIEKITEMTRNAKHIRITTPAGEDVEFDNAKVEGDKPNPTHPIKASIGYADVPGSHMMGGQIGWAPDMDSINGVIVFDGTISRLGKLEEPVHLTIHKGKITKITGGKQAAELELWIKSFNHPRMFNLAHVCYGFNPGAKLDGITAAEDERVWGCTQWGIGDIGPSLIEPSGVPAPSHTDGICLNSSVWLDGKKIMDSGKQVEPTLIKLANKLGKY